MRVNEMVREVHANAVAKGWWEGERSLSEIVVLAHSELSEAIEASRDNLPPICFLDKETDKMEEAPTSNEPGRFKPEGVAVELADCVIRIMDYFGKQGWNLEETLLLKMSYNKTRPHKHGGKAF